MGQKLYTNDGGGIAFSTERKPGEVRIPNYVYDLWLPLLGAEVIGVYAVYCCLERAGAVKQMRMRDLSNACRIGTDKLDHINAKLEQCGFVRIHRPTGQKRLMHWTTEITVLDPPRCVPPERMAALAPARGYEPLTPWLVADSTDLSDVEDKPSAEQDTGFPENPDRVSGDPSQVLHETPPGSPNIATLDLQPLHVAEEARSRAPAPPRASADSPDSPPQRDEPRPDQRPLGWGPCLSAGQQAFLTLFDAARFRNPTQADTVRVLEQRYGNERLLEAGRWAAKKGISLGHAIIAVETALKKQEGGTNGRDSTRSARPGTPPSGTGHPSDGSTAHKRPGDAVLPGVTREQMQRKLERLRNRGAHGSAADVDV